MNDRRSYFTKLGDARLENLGYEVYSGSLVEAAIKVPVAKVEAAYNKWVRPRLPTHWTTTPRSQRMSSKPPNDPTANKIQFFQEIIAWLDSKPYRTDTETKWMFWATKRIQDLKFPQEEVLL